MAASLVKSIKSLFPGKGHVTSYGLVTNIATNTGATAVTLAVNSVASATLIPVSQGLSNGIVRVRTNTIGVNSTSKVTSITATDGTTTVQLYGGDNAASAAGTGIDESFEFCTNLTLTSFTMNITTATNNCTHDVEIAGNL